MKTQEELNALKEEVEALNKKLAELSEEELAEVAGGMILASAQGPSAPTLDLSSNNTQGFAGSHARGPESYGMTDT